MSVLENELRALGNLSGRVKDNKEVLDRLVDTVNNQQEIIEKLQEDIRNLERNRGK